MSGLRPFLDPIREWVLIPEELEKRSLGRR